MWSVPDFSFSTDSSLKGCGGIAEGQYYHSVFPPSMRDLPIHALEMMAVLIGVRIWGHLCTGMKVQIYCDNEAAVSVINSGKTKDEFMGSCIRELWLVVAKFGFELRAVHLPGVENRVADWLSRWEVHPKYQQCFYDYIENEPIQYNEIVLDTDIFMFCGEL